MNQRRRPRKPKRMGLSLKQVIRKFDDEKAANQWFVERRWPDGIVCPYCDGENVSPRKSKRVTPVYRCNPCKRDFTVKTGTIMHDSKLPLSTWATAFYLMSTNLKGVSSTKLRRDLEISQRAAWHLAHRIRETWNDGITRFEGPLEVDEVFIGGKERNKHASKRLNIGGGTAGKTAVVGAKDRATGKVSAAVVPATDAKTLSGFVKDRIAEGAKLYTDDHAGYKGIPNHESVRHSAGEYVRGDVHTNGIESHWSMFKRGLLGTYHQVSVKHLHRYVTEFEGRHNQRPLDTIEQMSAMARGGLDKRLTYQDLIGPAHTRLNTKA